MSSSSPSPPLSSPPLGGPTSSTGGPPPPPPPPPPPSPVTSSNYFFGFVITFVVLFLLFIGCGLGSWRRFRLIGTAWDAQLQDMEGNPFGVRKRVRRRLVRPTFLETWTSRASSGPQHSAPCKWEGVQPIAAALVWSHAKLVASFGQRISCTDASTRVGRIRGTVDSAGVGEAGATLRAHLFPRRPQCEPRPPPVRRPPPEAIQIAVMIAMPSQPSVAFGKTTQEPVYVGQLGVGEYEIGVVRIAWPSGGGP